MQEDSAVSADSGCSFSGHSAEADQGPCDQRGRVLLDQSDEVILAPALSGHFIRILTPDWPVRAGVVESCFTLHISDTTGWRRR